MKPTNALAPWWAATERALAARRRDDVAGFLSEVGVCAAWLAEKSDALGALDPAVLAPLVAVGPAAWAEVHCGVSGCALPISRRCPPAEECAAALSGKPSWTTLGRRTLELVFGPRCHDCWRLLARDAK